MQGTRVPGELRCGLAPRHALFAWSRCVAWWQTSPSFFRACSSGTPRSPKALLSSSALLLVYWGLSQHRVGRVCACSSSLQGWMCPLHPGCLHAVSILGIKTIKTMACSFFFFFFYINHGICSRALPLSLWSQSPLAACGDVAGLELHCRLPGEEGRDAAALEGDTSSPRAGRCSEELALHPPGLEEPGLAAVKLLGWASTRVYFSQPGYCVSTRVSFN